MEENRLKHFRILAGLGVVHLGNISGVSYHTIYRIEAGYGAQQRTMAKLSKALDVEESALFPMPHVRVRVKKPTWAPSSMAWNVIIICPKCQSRFRILVSEGVSDPMDPGVCCPVCGFPQIVNIRRSA